MSSSSGLMNQLKYSNVNITVTCDLQSLETEEPDTLQQ